MSRYDSDDSAALMAQLWNLMLLFIITLLGGAFTIALWLTRTLYQLINFLTAGMLERLDGLLILAAGLLWGTVAAMALPILREQGLPYEESLLTLFVVGNLFGWCVGYCLLLELWQETTYPSAITPSFIEALHLPAAHYQQQPLPAVIPDAGMSVKELEALFRDANSSHAVAVSR